MLSIAVILLCWSERRGADPGLGLIVGLLVCYVAGLIPLVPFAAGNYLAKTLSLIPPIELLLLLRQEMFFVPFFEFLVTDVIYEY